MRILQGGSSGLIKSIQRGTITLLDNGASATATISAVVTANSFVTWGLSSTNINPSGWTSYNPGQLATQVVLTNSTTVTASKAGSSGTGTQSITVTYEVVEFIAGVLKSNTPFNIALGNGVSSNTAALPSVNTSKSFIVGATWTSNDSNAVIPAAILGQVVITNTTTATASRGASSTGTVQVSGAVLEFY